MANRHETTPRNHKRERAAYAAQRLAWTTEANGLDAGTIKADDVLHSLSTAQYAALALVALRGAGRGRRLAIGLPEPDYMEDLDTVLDAIEATYSACAQGKVNRSVAGFTYNAARSRGKRRAKDRIRETASVLVEPATDYKAPADAAAQTWAEILAACPPARREALNQAAALWSEGKDANRNALRNIRRTLGIRTKVKA